MQEKLPQRKQIRLKEYDYSQEGYYFITICTKNRLEILGKINKQNANAVGANCVRPQIQLSNVGKIIEYIRTNPLKWEEDKYYLER